VNSDGTIDTDGCSCVPVMCVGCGLSNVTFNSFEVIIGVNGVMSERVWEDKSDAAPSSFTDSSME
jgi:hypothetical protein